MHAERIRIRGLVQGVGFRPTVWRIAQELSLRGSVRNDGQGVVLDVWAAPELIEQLLQLLQTHLPALAQIDSIQRQVLSGENRPVDFQIVASEQGVMATDMVADAATCPACMAEVNDVADRRYRYAFTNCTHCGPRFSLVKAMPYDRANTSMAAFKMCPACQAEYDDPADRRFHAQPNACPACGPQLWLQDHQGQRIACDDAISHTAQLIQAGKIIAIKGIGGFHLACDASNEAVVAALRLRKQRRHKPFALLARDVAMVARYAHVDERAAALLQSSAAPIVLLSAQGEALAASVAPAQNQLAFALPATPLHHLLMQDLDAPIIFTSGNVSDAPPCIDNEDACDKLAAIADVFLLHDRQIINRIDDSVVSSCGERPRVMRRARGYTPSNTQLPAGFEDAPPLLALGAELKSTFSLAQAGRVKVSQHLGDLENAATLADYRQQIELYQSLYQHQPQAIVIDRHPVYLSSQYGRQLAEAQHLPCMEVQHHHAHIAAVMVEHGLPLNTKAVLGVALDGLGMGDDGELWGGEFFRADYRHYKRLASVDALPLLGGSQAMREPWRNTLAHLWQYFEWSRLTSEMADLELMQYLHSKPLATLHQMFGQGINSPRCSSVGRLFDAVAAALGVCRDAVSYEGQAALELEALALSWSQLVAPYPVQLNRKNEVWSMCWQTMWQALLQDLQQGRAPAQMAAAFHAGLAQGIADLVMQMCEDEALETVVLSGGVFNNTMLLQGVGERLSGRVGQVLTAAAFPAGDGGISLGQAAIASARLIKTR